ncbi:MAG: hypothetical protein IK099_10715 [Clostridia bacterium]|nr:hypothetical protein [Clostridia bacterium]
MNAENSLALTMRVKAESLNGISKDSLETINEWLDSAALTVCSGENSRAEISLEGESVLQADVEHRDGYTLTVFSPSGGTYLTAENAPDALTLFCGREMEWFDPSVIPGAYLKLAPQLYEKLSSHVTPKKSKEATSIKNASKAVSNETYTFSGDDMNEFWPRILDALLPVLEETLANQPGLCAKAEDLLEALEFSGECRFKRFLDKAGDDMGLQFTGNAGVNGDKRKVTLFYGFTPDKGGYLSFSAPAVKGKNNFKVTCAVQMTSKKNTRTLGLEGTYTRTLDGATVSGTLSASLKNTIQDDDEQWTGKVTISRTENKVKSTWTLTPKLVFSADGMDGTVAVQKKQGDRSMVKASFAVKLNVTEDITQPSAASAKDLREVSAELAKDMVQDEAEPLVMALSDLINPLNGKEKAAILNDIRTDAWMNGPITPALEAAVEWLTEEEEPEEEPEEEWDDDDVDG